MVVGSVWRASRHSQCRSRQAITLPEGNLRGVGDGAGFPGQDAYASFHATSPMAHFHGPLVHDLFVRLAVRMDSSPEAGPKIPAMTPTLLRSAPASCSRWRALRLRR